MSFSDFILALLVLAIIAGAIWVMDINPYSKQLQVYNQTCTEMILDNTYCKGKWIDDPVLTYVVDKENNTVTRMVKDQSNVIQYKNCSVLSRKNWSCTTDESTEEINASHGKITHETVANDEKRQITRLEWLQNRLLANIST